MSQTSSADIIQRIREGYEAFARGDLDAIRANFSPDIVWHIGGHNPMSRDYRGIDEVFGFFGQVFTETNGTLKNEVHDILASDDHQVVLLAQTGERNGKKLSSNVVQVTHSNGEGQITESWFVPLEAREVDEFWS